MTNELQKEAFVKLETARELLHYLPCAVNEKQESGCVVFGA